ncbi:SRPBCC family protein [Euzebya tangerina]|uniref:SRPBCC family protein n=1 Tax=Euzebya tangerina TaxID=591198 RepID=UPI000E31CE03|nr:SRPBCC domain-containing protein [Euzebya tangerina]
MTDTTTPDNQTEPAVVLERTLPAHIDLVWSMWAESEHFAAWYGPTGATIPTAEMDVRVDGDRKICMEVQTPDGPMQMWFVGRYLEVERPTRLVYTESVADAEGNVLSPAAMGMPDSHPETTEIIVELTTTDDGGTHLRMTHVGVPADSPGAAGWTMALDKLEARVADQAV